MSTRAWYDYYIIAPGPGTLSLAMRFYKWGDATPENALGEYLLFRERLHEHEDRLPVEWLDSLLREQLADLYEALPPQFATAAFLFLLQRASEEIKRDRWRRFDPVETRPDFHLHFALHEALTAEPFEIPPNPDPLLERVRLFVATARYLRPWRDYGLSLSLLDWLQYITQPTKSVDMGSLAGDWQPDRDIAYWYRLFFFLHPQDPFCITQIAIELCGRDGEDLLAPKDGNKDDWQRKQADAIRERIRESDIGIASLAILQHEYSVPLDRFWRFREQPDPEETRRCARLKPLRPSCNMLVRLVEKRFGPAVAAESRPLMEGIDEFDLLLQLVAPVLDTPDSAAWLAALRELVPAASGSQGRGGEVPAVTMADSCGRFGRRS